MLSNFNLQGLTLISKINYRNWSFIPSSKNDFGEIQVKKFPKDDFIVSIGDSLNADGESSVLKISSKEKIDFDFKFCQGIISNCVSVSTELLRFELCSSDVTKILETPVIRMFTSSKYSKSRKDAANNLSPAED